MTISAVVTEKLVVGGQELGGAVTIAGGLNVGINEAIPASQTDLEITFPLDVSAVLAFFAICDQDIVIETNDGGSPVDTITLTAGVPYWWRVGSAEAFALGTDVTSIFVTNTNAGTLKIQAILDPTPA
jgi:hypothetical protein